MAASLKIEAAYNIAANLGPQIVTAICGFILPPLIIRTFGSETNGMVFSIGQFVAYLSVVEAGIGGASIAALYKPLAENNATERNGILAATRHFYNRSGFFCYNTKVLLNRFL
jgi:O-antigen/teichoic acid export membrane protein